MKKIILKALLGKISLISLNLHLQYIKGEINHRMLSMQQNSVNFVIIVSSKLKIVVLENARSSYLILNNCI